MLAQMIADANTAITDADAGKDLVWRVGLNYYHWPALDAEGGLELSSTHYGGGSRISSRWSEPDGCTPTTFRDPSERLEQVAANVTAVRRAACGRAACRRVRAAAPRAAACRRTRISTSST